MKAPRLIVLACASAPGRPAGCRRDVLEQPDRAARRRGRSSPATAPAWSSTTAPPAACWPCYHGRREMRPASNMKLTTSASVLGRIGLRDAAAHARARDRHPHRRHAAREPVAGRRRRSVVLDAAVLAARVRRLLGPRARPRGRGALRRGAPRHGRACTATRARSTRCGAAPLWKSDSWMDCPPLSALTVNEDLLRFGSFATAPSPRPAGGPAARPWRCSGRASPSATGRTPASTRRRRGAVAAEPSPDDAPAGLPDGPGLGQLLRRDADQGSRRRRRPARHHPRPGSRLTRRYLQRPRRRPGRRGAPGRIRPVEGRPALGPPDRRHPPPRGGAAVRVVLRARAAAGRCERHPGGPDAVGARRTETRSPRPGRSTGPRRSPATSPPETATTWRSRS